MVVNSGIFGNNCSSLHNSDGLVVIAKRRKRKPNKFKKKLTRDEAPSLPTRTKLLRGPQQLGS